ncbi:MAG: NTP transferase domain-containing protein [Candidatus Eremiobacteraeota bacterium]|nr:NTP transferase domain-containing protein [Candidatus Eremiobacteraeota bacterium]
MKAVITAGGRINGEFARAAGTTVKALAPVRGATMLQRVIDALREAGATRIAVIGGVEVRRACSSVVECVIEESVSGSENLRKALDAWPRDGDRLLYATSDLPYITAAAVDDFLGRVSSETLAVPLTEWSDFQLRFPGAPPFGLTLAGERVVNGGVFAVPDASIPKLAALAARFFEARKAPWRMAGLVSPSVLLRFLFRRLSVADLERLAVRALGTPACGVRRAAAGLAYDVDLLEEYRYACAHD